MSDESLHKGCFWDRRHDEFVEMSCKETFSQHPTRTTPSSTPAPTPTATPQPIDIRPQVVKDLEAAGIKVQIFSYGGIPRFPGEESRHATLTRFWPILESLKQHFIDREESIHELTFASYTAYNSPRKNLSLDAALSEQEVLSYLSILDRRISWEKRTGITLDLNIEVHAHERGDKLAETRDKVSFFENNEGLLKGMRSVFHHIEMGASGPYYYMSDRQLTIKKDLYQTQLSEVLRVFADVGPFFEFADSNSIPLNGGFYTTQEFPDLVAAARVLHAEKTSVASLKAMGKLNLIEFRKDLSQTFYSRYNYELAVPTKGDGLAILGSVIKALALQQRVSTELGIDVDATLELKENYVEATRRLSALYPLIQTKKNYLERITLSTTSSYQNKMLYIGYQGNQDELEKLIRGIH